MVGMNFYPFLILNGMDHWSNHAMLHLFLSSGLINLKFLHLFLKLQSYRQKQLCTYMVSQNRRLISISISYLQVTHINGSWTTIQQTGSARYTIIMCSYQNPVHYTSVQLLPPIRMIITVLCPYSGETNPEAVPHINSRLMTTQVSFTIT